LLNFAFQTLKYIFLLSFIDSSSITEFRVYSLMFLFSYDNDRELRSIISKLVYNRSDKGADKETDKGAALFLAVDLSINPINHIN
jgi:hypothetical protein